MNTRLAVLIGVVATTLFVVERPQLLYAVPGFARGSDVTCTHCHTVWPQLNATGREFKKTGYSDVSLKAIDEGLSLNVDVPVSGRLNMRLIDKRTSRLSTADTLRSQDKQLKVRALHEAEVFLAGRAGERVSFFAEVEAEDEWPDPNGDAPGFQMQLATGAVQVLLNEYVTAYGGYASPFYADGYNTLDYHKTHRREWSAAGKGFVPGSSQVIGLAAHGDRVSGLVAWGGNPGDLEGHDPKDFTGRVAVDVTPSLMVGGFGNLSKAYDSSTGESEDKTTRYGVDAQVEVNGLAVNAVFAIRDDDVANETENNISVEALYSAEVESKIVSVVAPYVAVDRYTIMDGEESFINAGAFLSLMHGDNFRSQIGWEGNLSVPDFPAPDDYKHKESRITVVFDLGF
jgi:hypothetical protein